MSHFSTSLLVPGPSSHPSDRTSPRIGSGLLGPGGKRGGSRTESSQSKKENWEKKHIIVLHINVHILQIHQKK